MTTDASRGTWSGAVQRNRKRDRCPVLSDGDRPSCIDEPRRTAAYSCICMHSSTSVRCALGRCVALRRDCPG